MQSQDHWCSYLNFRLNEHLQLFSRYWTLSVYGSRTDLLGSRDVIGHVTIGYPIGHFLLVVLRNQASI